MNNELKIIFLICSIITSVLCFIIVMALLSSGNPQENSAGAIFYCIVMPIVMWIIYSQLPSNKKYENHNNANYKNETMSTNNEGYLDISDKAEIETAEYNNEQAINLLEQAQIYSQKEDYENANKCATQAIEINPQYAEAYNTRALAYFGLQDFTKEVNDLKKSIEISPEQESTNVMIFSSFLLVFTALAENRTSIEDMDIDVIKHCEAICLEFNKPLFACINAQDTLSSENVIESCDKIIAKFKNKFSFPYAIKAFMYLRMTDDNKFSNDLSEKILENFEQALKINNANLFAKTVKSAYYNWYITNIYFSPNIERNEFPLIDINIIKFLINDDLWDKSKLSIVLNQVAEASANEVIKRFPYIYNIVTKPELINVDRTMLFEAIKNDSRLSEHIPVIAQADKYAEVAIIANPKDKKGYIARSLAKLTYNKRDEALIDIDKAIEIDPSDGYSCNIKGLIYQLQGKDKKVVDLVKTFLEKYPDTDDNLKEVLNELLQKSELKASHTEAIENTHNEDLGRELDI